MTPTNSPAPDRKDGGPLPPLGKFHLHLDQCSRCRNQPFNLCPVGARLLEQAVRAVEFPNVR